MLFSTPGSRCVCAEEPSFRYQKPSEIPRMEQNGNTCEDDLQGADEEEEVDPRIQVGWDLETYSECG